MGFGKTILINKNQFALESGNVTIVKFPNSSKYKGKGVMIASRYVNDGSFWINPNWEYKIKSGKNLTNDYGIISGDDLISIFKNCSDQLEYSNSIDNESYLKVENPVPLKGEISIDFD